MPPPPPRPPPGPPPPPAPGFASPAVSKPPPVTQDRSAVLLDIQKGARLKKVDRSQIKDRSSPLVPGAASADSLNGSVTSSSGSVTSSSGRNNAPRTENGTAASGGMVQPPPGLGGLFANGMPTLKRTGLRPQGTKESPPEENKSPPVTHSVTHPVTHPVSNHNVGKPKPPPAPAFSPPPPSANGPSVRNHPVVLPPKPANLQPVPPPSNQQRRSSDAEFNGPLSPPPGSAKPVPNPKPAGPGFNPMTSGSATLHVQRTVDRPSINSMTLQKPKHPPPPLPPGPPPTRNISQTLGRPVRHQRPSLTGVEMNQQDASPPPVPGRPPSFRKSGDERPRAGAPIPPPPPPASFGGENLVRMNGPSAGSVSGSGNVQRNGPLAGGYPLPPMNGIGGSGGMYPRPSAMGSMTDGLMSNAAGQRPAPPSRPPVTTVGHNSNHSNHSNHSNGVGMPHSASAQSLPGSPGEMIRPPKRHDSLQTVTQDHTDQPSVVLNAASVQALNQVIGRSNGVQQVQAQVPRASPSGRQGQPSRASLAQEFEAKFSFHRIGELPQPLPFSGKPKTYPSSKTRPVSRPLAPAPPVQY